MFAHAGWDGVSVPAQRQARGRYLMAATVWCVGTVNGLVEGLVIWTATCCASVNGLEQAVIIRKGLTLVLHSTMRVDLAGSASQ